MLLHADGAIQDDRVVPENGAAGTLGKIFYLVFIGWWLGLLYAIVGFVMLATIIGSTYSLPLFNLGWYFLWPFDKHVSCDGPLDRAPVEEQEAPEASRRSDDGGDEAKKKRKEQEEEEWETTEGTGVVRRKRLSADKKPSSQGEDEEEASHEQPPPRGGGAPSPSRRSPSCAGPGFSWHYATLEEGVVGQISFFLFLGLGLPLLFVAHWIAATMLWLAVVTIPMARLNAQASVSLLAVARISVHTGAPRDETPNLLLWRSWAGSEGMLRMTIYDTAIIMFNLNGAILLTLFFGFGLGHHFVTQHFVLCFFLALLAVIPISNYIGDAVSSIAAQTTPVLGALLNGGLECLVEIIVYLMAINGGMGVLARDAIVGTVLAVHACLDLYI